MVRILFAAIIFLAGSFLAGFAIAESPQATFFRDKVEPILVGRCLECHGVETKGELDLRTKATAFKGGESGQAISPGEPDLSLLFDYVSTGEMPPKEPLTKEEVATLKRWIADGAYYPDKALDLFAATSKSRAGRDWWSFQPLAKTPPPTSAAANKYESPIDRFVVDRLARAGLAMSKAADRRILIRRLSLDLTGLSPSFEQVEAFVSDTRADAYRRLVDRLLASPHYGERWGRHWLDVVRYAESNGFERDRIRTNFWRYRDYVIRSFNDDKPYNQFVREQLAGDAIDADDPELLIATGFLVAGPKNDVTTVSELEQLQTRQDELDEYVTTMSTTFLGLTSGCARCHEHKFDPIDMRDYYGLTAVFSGLGRADNTVATLQEKQQYAAATAGIKKQIASNKAKSGLLAKTVNQRLAAEIAENRPGKLLPSVNYQRNEDRFKPLEASFVRFTITATSNNSQPCLDELEVYGAEPKTNLALASAGCKATASSLLPGYKIHQIEHLNDGKHGNSHSWISNESGTGWVQLELASATQVQRVVWGRDRESQYKDRLPVRYRIEVSTDGKQWTKVSDDSHRLPFDQATALKADQLTAAFTADEKQQYEQLKAELAELEKKLKSVPPLPVSYSVRDKEPQPAFVLHRGDVRSRGEQVGPSTFQAVAMLDSSLAQEKNDSGPNRRLQLADWIVDPKNPLTARVFVNRLWHHHFGQGMVNTQNDFGFNGDQPSHLELLDWLADDFMNHGWKVKRLQRMIVMTEAYRQQSAFNAKAAAKDGANRLLWRMSPRRLDAESLRDAILQVSGKLDLKMGGPSFRLFEYVDGNVPDYVLLEKTSADTMRRAVYRFNIRTFQSPLMSAFDCPDASVQTPRRDQSTTALQALSLMNNQFIFEQAKSFASRVKAAAGDDSQAQAAAAYRLVLLRDPSEQQLQDAAKFIEEQGLFSLCRLLLNTNEFLYVF